MLPRCVACLLSALTLTAALPADLPPPPLGDSLSGRLSVAEQLSTLLEPAVERGVARAFTSWQLGRLSGQLDQLLGGAADPRRAQRRLDRLQEPEDAETVCERFPEPLSAEEAPHQEPAVRACARSCLQLRDQGGSPQDGVYWFTGMPVPTLCDFSHDGGGWTLLLTSVSHQGWDASSILARAATAPTLSDNYSILRHADAVRDLGLQEQFAFRIETQAHVARRRWGGVWFAPRRYSLTAETPSQTEVTLVRRFNHWALKDNGPKNMVPWINTGIRNPEPLLTMANASGNWWGTLVTYGSHSGHPKGPWIHPEASTAATALYWVREEAL